MKLKYDPQFTIYCLWLGYQCHLQKDFAKTLGVTEEDAKQWGGNPVYLSDKIKSEYYLVRENKTYDMPRTDIQYPDFCSMVDGLEARLDAGLIHPERGRNCDYCEINKECDRLSSQYKGKIVTSPQLKLFNQLT